MQTRTEARSKLKGFITRNKNHSLEPLTLSQERKAPELKAPEAEALETLEPEALEAEELETRA